MTTKKKYKDKPRRRSKVLRAGEEIFRCSKHSKTSGKTGSKTL